MPLAPRHGRFLTALGLGLAAGLISWAQAIAPAFALLTAVDAFFLTYLVLTARILGATGPEELRRHAEADDEGVALILLLAGLAVLVSVTAIFLVLNADAAGIFTRLVALASLPLGWATIHTVVAFHLSLIHI